MSEERDTTHLEAQEKPKRTFSEEIELQGEHLVERVKDIIAQGNVRKLIIRNAEDKNVVELSLTTATIAGGMVVLAAPWLAALGAIAALVARLKIEIVREVPEGEEEAPKE